MKSKRSLAIKIFKLLSNIQGKLVLAESCTGGAAAAALTSVPGISQNFCGSFVTYRDDSKARWLKVSRSTLRNLGAVSARTAFEMAKGALNQTPEATLSAAITGHLGPQAPRSLDGKIFICVCYRNGRRILSKKINLQLPRDSKTSRIKRQQIASLHLLMMVRSLLESKLDSTVGKTHH